MTTFSLDTRRVYSIGIDAGSTTIKFVVLNREDGSVAYSSYRRHFADIRKCLEDTLADMESQIGNDSLFRYVSQGLPALDSLSVPDSHLYKRFWPQVRQ